MPTVVVSVLCYKTLKLGRNAENFYSLFIDYELINIFAMSCISACFFRSLLTARISNPSLPLYFHYLIMPPQFSNSLYPVDPKHIIAVDCEYVGTGPKGSVSVLGIFFCYYRCFHSLIVLQRFLTVSEGFADFDF